MKVWDATTGIEQASVQRPAGAITAVCAESSHWDRFMEQANLVGRFLLADSTGKLEAVTKYRLYRGCY